VAILNRRQVKLKRSHIHKWLIDWRALDPDTRPSKEDYIRGKIINGPHGGDVLLNDEGDEVSVADFIMDDLRNYA
jgi:hypothetical protein